MYMFRIQIRKSRSEKQEFLDMILLLNLPLWPYIYCCFIKCFNFGNFSEDLFSVVTLRFCS